MSRATPFRTAPAAVLDTMADQSSAGIIGEIAASLAASCASPNPFFQWRFA